MGGPRSSFSCSVTSIVPNKKCNKKIIKCTVQKGYTTEKAIVSELT